jgi:tRNA threonylcarbamoyladenosine biosynthesis protein TsaB
LPLPEAILALETSGAEGSVALLQGDRLRERGLPADVPTAEALLPAVDALLREAGVALSELSGFAVSIGPGSFTGLRIGVATVKGLAFGSDRPVAAVPTLAVLAAGAPGPGPVVALLDARRGEAYAAGYRAPGDLEPAALPEGLYGGEALASRLPAGCRLVGEAAALAAPALGQAPRLVSPPRAADVGRLGRVILARGQGVPAAILVPRYVRRAEAEVRRTGLATESPDTP